MLFLRGAPRFSCPVSLLLPSPPGTPRPSRPAAGPPHVTSPLPGTPFARYPRGSLQSFGTLLQCPLVSEGVSERPTGRQAAPSPRPLPCFTGVCPLGSWAAGAPHAAPREWEVGGAGLGLWCWLLGAQHLEQRPVHGRHSANTWREKIQTQTLAV